ncbi:hypothetical protein [Pedobacter sp. B4-66]|uniref:hypothetical protein n=1 Tax=Pedobacter sp. B4-66 TaxID=2817280 RepID=UPI001BDA4B15|nr:hypothetical protein [Pedobacter sp. B4-66]
MTNIVKHSSNTNNLTVFNPFDREQASIMKEMALDMAYSDLVPDMYRFKETDPDKMAIAERKAVANCMIAMNMALRMGAEPLMVMQNMYIVQGRPSWSSKFLIATVNTCGRFTPMQYKIENKGKIGVLKATRAVWKLLPGESQKRKVMESYDETAYKDMDDITCVAYATDLASGKELISSVVSIKMACLEGWYDKDGSKWKTMPEKMLRYRAASFWTNEYAPEISMGMRTEEEIQDIVDTEYVDVTNQKVSDNVQSTIDQNANTKTVDFDDKEPEAADENKSAIQPSEKFDQSEQKKEDSPEVKMNF